MSNPTSQTNPGSRTQWWRGALIAAAALLLVALFIYAFQFLATSLLIAFGVAYLLDPPVTWLENHGVRRPLGVTVLLLLFFVVAALVLLLLLPVLIEQLREFTQLLPDKLRHLYHWIDAKLVATFGVALPATSSQAMDKLRALGSHVDFSLAKQLTAFTQQLLSNVLEGVLTIFSLLLIPMFAIYLLMDYRSVVANLEQLVPRRWLTTSKSYLSKIHAVLAGFLRGQVTLVLVLAFLYSCGFIWVDFPLALFVGILSGLLHFIPYLGPATALVFGLTMIFTDFAGWVQLLQFFIVFAAIQGLESFLLTPKLVGKRLGLAPISSIIALIVFGKLFGFAGLLLAIPLAAMAKVFIAEGLQHYRKSPFYKNS